MRTTLFLCTALVITSLAVAQPAVVLPVDLELKLAASALPAHMRADATLYRYTDNGYVVAREGTNGFSCLTRQIGISPTRFHGAFMTVCYDAEGSETLLQSDLLQGKLFAEGKTHDEVAEVINAKWADGSFRRPNHGIAYMLSPVQHLRMVGAPRPGGYIPHLMFYAPGHQNAAVRGNARPNPMAPEPYMAAPGQPWAMIIVPMAPEVRAQIAEEHKELLAEMKPFIDAKVAQAK